MSLMCVGAHVLILGVLELFRGELLGGQVLGFITNLSPGLLASQSTQM